MGGLPPHPPTSTSNPFAGLKLPESIKLPEDPKTRKIALAVAAGVVALALILVGGATYLLLSGPETVTLNEFSRGMCRDVELPAFKEITKWGEDNRDLLTSISAKALDGKSEREKAKAAELEFADMATRVTRDIRGRIDDQVVDKSNGEELRDELLTEYSTMLDDLDGSRSDIDDIDPSKPDSADDLTSELRNLGKVGNQANVGRSELMDDINSAINETDDDCKHIAKTSKSAGG